MRRPTLRARLVATTTVAAIVTVAVVVLGVQLSWAHLAQTQSLGVLQDRADAAATTLRGSPQHVRVLEVPSNALDQDVWIYDLHGARVDGNPPSPLLSRAVKSLSVAPRQESRIVAERYRLLAKPARAQGRGPVVAVVVAGVDLTPYESSERRGLWLSLALGALIVVAAAAASWVAATYSLRQVRWMAHQADSWREHDLAGRFALGPPGDELAELAQTLDRMLDRIAQAILTERHLTDEVAHELRTPLTVIRTEAQLALLESNLPAPVRESLVAIDESTERMDRSISTVLAVARSTHADGRACTAQAALEEINAHTPARDGISVTVLSRHGHGNIAAPHTVVVAALSPIVDNAMRHARTTVTLTARQVPPRMLLVIDDDGPGVPQDEVELIFAPGRTSSNGGAGLGLALARRLAHSIGGTVHAEAKHHGRFVVDLPGV